MAGIKMPWSTGDDTKAALLHKLQKSVHFMKTIGSSHMPYADKPVCAMAVPVWFVKKHGDKFERTVYLWSGLSTKPWPVQISICKRPSKSPEIKFGGGWRSFAASNGLLEGDDLLFSLRAMSEFDVRVFRKTGNSVKSSSFQASRKRPQDFEVEVRRSGRCRDQHLVAERSEGSLDDLSELSTKKKKKKRVEEEDAAFAFHSRSTAGRSTSSNLNLHWLESRNLRSDSHQGQESPVRELEDLEKPCAGDNNAQLICAKTSNANESKNEAVEETRKLPLSFVRRLTARNFYGTKNAAYLEIPKSFVRTYGSELRPPMVKLQGIYERCPMRIVVCEWRFDGKSSSRLCLTDGWIEFGDENGLEVGQELLFTLTANSSLVVRVHRPGMTTPSTEQSL